MILAVRCKKPEPAEGCSSPGGRLQTRSSAAAGESPCGVGRK